MKRTLTFYRTLVDITKDELKVGDIVEAAPPIYPFMMSLWEVTEIHHGKLIVHNDGAYSQPSYFTIPLDKGKDKSYLYIKRFIRSIPEVNNDER